MIVQFTFVWGSQMHINETECFCDDIKIQNHVSQQNIAGLNINTTTEIVLKWGKLDPHILIAVVNAGLTVANIRFSGSADSSPVKLILRPLNQH